MYHMHSPRQQGYADLKYIVGLVARYLTYRSHIRHMVYLPAGVHKEQDSLHILALGFENTKGSKGSTPLQWILGRKVSLVLDALYC